jgi:hypothetical protein
MPTGLPTQITDLSLYPYLPNLDFEQIFHPPD